MHARLNFVDVRPERFADMDPYWRDTVAAYGDVLVRGWFLRAGESVRTLSLVLFSDETAALENTREHLGAAAAAASAYRMSEPRVSLARVMACAASAIPARATAARLLAPGAQYRGAMLESWPAALARWRRNQDFAGACLLDESVSDGVGRLCAVSFWATAPAAALAQAPLPKDSSDVESWPESWMVRVDVGSVTLPCVDLRGDA